MICHSAIVQLNRSMKKSSEVMHPLLTSMKRIPQGGIVGQTISIGSYIVHLGGCSSMEGK